MAVLEGEDLIEQYVNEDGRPALRLTERGAATGRASAMGEDADAEAVLDVLLDVSGPDT